jgi:hypothetical protein
MKHLQGVYGNLIEIPPMESAMLSIVSLALKNLTLPSGGGQQKQVFLVRVVHALDKRCLEVSDQAG